MKLTITLGIVTTYPWRYDTTITPGILVATANL